MTNQVSRLQQVVEESSRCYGGEVSLQALRKLNKNNEGLEVYKNSH